MKHLKYKHDQLKAIDRVLLHSGGLTVPCRNTLNDLLIYKSSAKRNVDWTEIFVEWFRTSRNKEDVT